MGRNNNIEMYSTRNEGKSVVAERFSGTLKNKIYIYMTLVSKNMYIDSVKIYFVLIDTIINITAQLK